MDFLRAHRKALLIGGAVLVCLAAALLLVHSTGPGDIDITKAEFKLRLDSIFAIDSPIDFEILSARDMGLSIDDYAESVDARYYPEEYERLKAMLALEKWESPRQGCHGLVISSDSLCPRAYHFNTFTFWLDDSTRGLTVNFIHE
jgi:hypothetical protein